MIDHVSLQCADVADSAKFYDAAVAQCAEVLYQPGVWTEYHPVYFGRVVRDLDGNNVVVVYHAPE